MFTDIWIARRNALGLSKTLMVATLVITAGAHFSVVTADEFDGDTTTIVNEYDPFAWSTDEGPPPLPYRCR